MSSKPTGNSPDFLLNPLAGEPGKPVFDEQWQAQVLAMADLLIQSGQIDAAEWSQVLGRSLKKWQPEQADTITNYYCAVLEALAMLIDQKELLTMDQISQREDDWKSAYLSTPHGQPVKLSGK